MEPTGNQNRISVNSLKNVTKEGTLGEGVGIGMSCQYFIGEVVILLRIGYFIFLWKSY